MNIKDKVAVVTGAAGGIGFAVARRLAKCGARAVAACDSSPRCTEAAATINRELGVGVGPGVGAAAGTVVMPFCGDVCDADFRAEVFSRMAQCGDVVRICVPAAGILRDALAVKIDRESGCAQLYDADIFRRVLEVNLLHPTYWAMQMLAGIAERGGGADSPVPQKWQPSEPIRGSVVLIGSVSSRGNRGQISYACAKSALNAAATTLNLEGMAYGVQTKIIHPGMVDTPMLDNLPAGHFETRIKPQIPLGRLISPDEIATAATVLIENPAISGQLWVDGGLAPMA